MTKTDYLKELDHYLKRLPRTDYEEAMAYFTEYFDEAGEENVQAVIADLGTPKEAANELIHNLLDNQSPLPSSDRKRSKKDTWLLVILGILSAPVTIPAILSALASLVAGLAVATSLLLAGFALSLGAILIGLISIWDSLSLVTAGSAFPMILGGGLVILNLGVLGLLLTTYLTRVFGRALLAAGKWIIRKGRKHV